MKKGVSLPFFRLRRKPAALDSMQSAHAPSGAARSGLLTQPGAAGRLRLRRLLNSWKSVLQLLRFLFWYGIVVATLLFVLPAAGVLFEQSYDALSSTLKFFSVLGIFAVVCAWQVLAMRDRR
jgi:hypothetical protein